MHTNNRDNAKRYHLIILLSAVTVLTVGALYRTSLKEKAGEVVPPRLEALNTELQELKTSLGANELEGIQQILSDAAQKSMPAVVSLRPRATAPAPVIPLYRDLAPTPDPTAWQTSGPSLTGAGIILDHEGYILTSARLAGAETTFDVTLANGVRGTAHLVKRAEDLPLALVKLQSPQVAPAVGSFAEADLQVGHWLARLGRAPSGEPSVSLALLSVIRQTTSGEKTLYLGADLLPEQDGGPAINLSGQIVAISLFPADSTGPGITIPIARALTIAQRLKTGQDPPPPSWIGVELQSLDANLKQYHAIDAGVLITSVQFDSPAQRAGLRPGDIIRTVQGAPVDDAPGLVALIQQSEPGNRLSMVVRRKGQELPIEVEVTRHTPTFKDAEGFSAAPGLVLPAFDIELVRNGSGGARISKVLPTSAAFSLGLRPGDLITAVNQTPVQNPGDLQRRLLQIPTGRLQLWQIQRNGSRFFIAIAGKGEGA